LASLIAMRTFSISASLDASTVTPGSTAPDVSLTTPEIEAWANAAEGRRISAAAAVPARNHCFIMASMGLGNRRHLYSRSLRW